MRSAMLAEKSSSEAFAWRLSGALGDVADCVSTTSTDCATPPWSPISDEIMRRRFSWRSTGWSLTAAAVEIKALIFVVVIETSGGERI